MLDAKSKLRDAVKLASRALIKQHLQGNPYDSALVSYTAARAVSEQNQAWLEPDPSPHFLPALFGILNLLSRRTVMSNRCSKRTLIAFNLTTDILSTLR